MDDKKKWTIDLRTENGLLEPFQANLKIETSMDTKRTIDVFGEVIDESEIYSDVDRYFDICDSSVELGFSLTDLKNTLKFRSVKNGSTIDDKQIRGFYVKDSKDSAIDKIATVIDNKIINWVKQLDNQKGDKSNDFKIATQLRVVDSGNNFLVTHINPNANNKTKGFDGKPLGEMTGALLSDVFYGTPNAHQTLSAPHDLSSSLAHHNTDGIGKQFINELFNTASVPADKVNNSDTSAFYCGQELDIPGHKNNKNLYQLVSQLMQSNPERFQHLDTSKDYVPLPIKEGDEVSFILNLAIEIGAVDNTQEHTKALYQLVKSGIAVNETPSFEKPVISNGEISANYSLRKCKFLLTFRCTNTDAERKQDITNKIASFTQICDPVMKNAQTLVNNVEKIEGELKDCEDRMDDSNKECDKQQLVVNNNTAIIDGAGDKNVYGDGDFDIDNYIGSYKMSSNANEEVLEKEDESNAQSKNYDEKKKNSETAKKEKDDAKNLLEKDMTALSHADEVLADAKKKHLISSELVNGRGNKDHVEMNHENYMGTAGVFDSKSKAFGSAEKAYKTAVSNGINSESEKKAMGEASEALSDAKKEMEQTREVLDKNDDDLDIAQKDQKIKYGNVYGRQEEGVGTTFRDATKYVGSLQMVENFKKACYDLEQEVKDESSLKTNLETDKNAISTMKGKIENYYASDMKYLDSMKAALSEADRVHNEANELVDSHKETLEQLEEEHTALVEILNDVRSTPDFTSDVQEEEAVEAKATDVNNKKKDIKQAVAYQDGTLKDLDIAKANKKAAYKTVYGRQVNGAGDSVRDASGYMGSVHMTRDANLAEIEAAQIAEQTNDIFDEHSGFKSAAEKAAADAKKLYENDLSDLKTISKDVTRLNKKVTDLKKELEPLYSIAHEKNKNLKDANEILDAIMKLPGIVITDEKRDEINELEDKMQVAKQNYDNNTDGEGLLELYETAKTAYDESLLGFKSTTAEKKYVELCEDELEKAQEGLDKENKELRKYEKEYTDKKAEKVAIYKTIYGRQEEGEEGTNVRDASNYLGSGPISIQTKLLKEEHIGYQNGYLDQVGDATKLLSERGSAAELAAEVYKADMEQLGQLKEVYDTDDKNMRLSSKSLNEKKIQQSTIYEVYTAAKETYDSVLSADYKSIKFESDALELAAQDLESVDNEVSDADKLHNSNVKKYQVSLNNYSILSNNIYGRQEFDPDTNSELREDNYMGSLKNYTSAEKSKKELASDEKDLAETVGSNYKDKLNMAGRKETAERQVETDGKSLNDKEESLRKCLADIDTLNKQKNEISGIQETVSKSLESLKKILADVKNTSGVVSTGTEEKNVEDAQAEVKKVAEAAEVNKKEIAAKEKDLETATTEKSLAYHNLNGDGDKTTDDRGDANYKGSEKIHQEVDAANQDAIKTWTANTLLHKEAEKLLESATNNYDNQTKFKDGDEKELGVNDGENSTGVYKEQYDAQEDVNTKQKECDAISVNINNYQDEYDNAKKTFYEISAISDTTNTESELSKMKEMEKQLNEYTGKGLTCDKELADNKGILEEKIEKVKRVDRNLNGAGDKNTINRVFVYSHYIGSLRISDIRNAERVAALHQHTKIEKIQKSHKDTLEEYAAKNKEAFEFNVKNITDLGVPSSPADADVKAVVANGFYVDLEGFKKEMERCESENKELYEKQGAVEADYVKRRDAYEKILATSGTNAESELEEMKKAKKAVDGVKEDIANKTKETNEYQMAWSQTDKKIKDMVGTIFGRGSKDESSLFDNDGKYKGSLKMHFDKEHDLENSIISYKQAEKNYDDAMKIKEDASKNFNTQNKYHSSDSKKVVEVGKKIDDANKEKEDLSTSLREQELICADYSEKYDDAKTLYNEIVKIGGQSDTELAAMKSAEDLFNKANTEKNKMREREDAIDKRLYETLMPEFDEFTATLMGRQTDGKGTTFRDDGNYKGSKDELDQITKQFVQVCKDLETSTESFNKKTKSLKEAKDEKGKQETFHKDNVDELGVRSCEADDSESIYPVAATRLYKEKEEKEQELEENNKEIKDMIAEFIKSEQKLKKLKDAYEKILAMSGTNTESEQVAMDTAEKTFNDIRGQLTDLEKNKINLEKVFYPLVGVVHALEKTIYGRQDEGEDGTFVQDASGYMGSNEMFVLAVAALLKAVNEFEDAILEKDNAFEVLKFVRAADEELKKIYENDMKVLGVPSYEGDDHTDDVEASGLYEKLENAIKEKDASAEMIKDMDKTIGIMFKTWQEARDTYLNHLQDDYVSIDEEKKAMTDAWDEYVRNVYVNKAKLHETHETLHDKMDGVALLVYTCLKNINGRGKKDSKVRDIDNFVGVQKIYDELVQQRIIALGEYDRIRNSGDDNEIAKAKEFYEGTNTELNMVKEVLDERNHILSESKIFSNKLTNILVNLEQEHKDKTVEFDLARTKANAFVRRGVRTHLAKYNGLRERDLVLGDGSANEYIETDRLEMSTRIIKIINKANVAESYGENSILDIDLTQIDCFAINAISWELNVALSNYNNKDGETTTPLGEWSNDVGRILNAFKAFATPITGDKNLKALRLVHKTEMN